MDDVDKTTTSIMMCGVGGQGILLASEIAAQAAILAGYRVKTNEVHGMAQRGGSVVANVRFGAEVHSPLIERGSADALLSLEAIEALRCHSCLKPGGLAVVSRQRVIPITVSSGRAQYPEPEPPLRAVFPNLLYIDALRLAEELGEPRAANLVLLGGLARAIHRISREVWHESIRKCVKSEFAELNLKAFEIGSRQCQEP